MQKKEFSNKNFAFIAIVIVAFFAVGLWSKSSLIAPNAVPTQYTDQMSSAMDSSSFKKSQPSPLTLENDISLVESCSIFLADSPLLLNATGKHNCIRAGKEYATMSHYERSLTPTLPSTLVNLAMFSLQTSSTLTVNGKPFLGNGHNATPAGSVIGGKQFLMPTVSKLTVPSGVLLYISDESPGIAAVCASISTPDHLYSWTINETANDSSGGLHLGLPCKPLS